MALVSMFDAAVLLPGMFLTVCLTACIWLVYKNPLNTYDDNGKVNSRTGHCVQLNQLSPEDREHALQDLLGHEHQCGADCDHDHSHEHSHQHSHQHQTDSCDHSHSDAHDSCKQNGALAGQADAQQGHTETAPSASES